MNNTPNKDENNTSNESNTQKENDLSQSDISHEVEDKERIPRYSRDNSYMDSHYNNIKEDITWKSKFLKYKKRGSLFIFNRFGDYRYQSKEI